FEPAHMPLSLSGVLMRDFSAIVSVAASVVGHMRQHRSECGSITLQLVSDDPKWFFALVSQQSLKESLGCTPIPMRLNENVDDVAVLIDGTPKVLLLAVDSHEQLVQMPSIAEATLSSSETLGIVGSELPAPSRDGFVRNDDAAFSKKIFNITEAHTK